jgi:hypothetical protein
MKARSLKSLLAVTALVLLGACGSKAELGEVCDDVGSTEPCEDGLVCDSVSQSTESTACFKVCGTDADCASTEQCTGVSKGSLKACHPKV